MIAPAPSTTRHRPPEVATREMTAGESSPRCVKPPRSAPLEKSSPAPIAGATPIASIKIMNTSARSTASILLQYEKPLSHAAYASIISRSSPLSTDGIIASLKGQFRLRRNANKRLVKQWQSKLDDVSISTRRKQYLCSLFARIKSAPAVVSWRRYRFSLPSARWRRYRQLLAPPSL